MTEKKKSTEVKDLQGVKILKKKKEITEAEKAFKEKMDLRRKAREDFEEKKEYFLGQLPLATYKKVAVQGR